MADLKTVTLKGVELMGVGTWQGHNCPDGGCPFTTDDLDEMVRAYEATKGTFDAPVKLGHDDSQKLLQKDGYPAAGWVTNLRRVGDKLVGDLEKVPAAIGDLIRAGAYRKRSSEIRPEAEVNGKKFKWLFSGLALLGADLPAVEGLKDITQLYAKLSLEIDEQEQFQLGDLNFADQASAIDSLITRLDALVEEAEGLIHGRKGAPKLRALVATAKDELRRVAPKNHSQENNTVTIDEKALREKLGIGEEDDLLAAVDALKATKVDAGDGGDKTEELSKLEGRVLELETEKVKLASEALVTSAINEGKLLPSQKDFAIGFATRDAEGFKKFIESQPKVVELGERGASGGSNPNMTELEPTDAERKVAVSLGIWNDDYRVKLMRQKAEAKGIELPLDFGKSKS